jgi:hypothetical protein
MICEFVPFGSAQGGKRFFSYLHQADLKEP